MSNEINMFKIKIMIFYESRVDSIEKKTIDLHLKHLKTFLEIKMCTKNLITLYLMLHHIIFL